MSRSGPPLRRRFFRVKAFLLLAIFLAAGTSLPSLDALAYHGESEETARSQTHVEPAGGCLSHIDNCTLGRGAPGSGAGLTGCCELRLVDTPVIPHHAVHVLPPLAADLFGIPQPRAPPVRFV